MPLSGGFTAAALASPTLGPVDLGGAYVFGPGSYFAIGSLTTVTGFGFFSWMEIPIAG